MDDNLQRILQTTALLVFFAMPVTIAVGGALFVPWRRSYWSTGHVSRVLGRHGWVVAGLVLMLIPAYIVSAVDPFIYQALNVDYTNIFYNLEDGFHAWLQESLRPAQGVLQPVFTAVYVGGYPALIILTPMLGVWLDDRILARRALGAYALAFAFALPFYLFFPVQEVWYSYSTCPVDAPADLAACNNGAVQNLGIKYPFVLENIYAYNELNNCFPSLHTAMSVAMAGVAWRSRAPRRYVAFATLVAAGIVFSTVYLGVHWVADVVAGLLLAALVVKLVERYWPDPPPVEPAPEAAM